MPRRVLNLLATLSLLCAAGCQSYVPVSVQVLDAETGAPMPGARVHSKICFGMTLFPPSRSTAVTDRRGRAVVKISDMAAAGLRGATATFPGYLQADDYFREDRFKELRRIRRPSRAVAQSAKADLVIKLYREPHPYFVLVVPNGYRGLLRLDLSGPTTERELLPHERAVEVTLRPPAPQKLPWCRLGRHFIDWKHFTARYEGGTPIPSSSHDGSDIALRMVTAHNQRYIYVIGTAEDVQAARAPILDLFQHFDAVWNADVTR